MHSAIDMLILTVSNSPDPEPPRDWSVAVLAAWAALPAAAVAVVAVRLLNRWLDARGRVWLRQRLLPRGFEVRPDTRPKPVLPAGPSATRSR